MTTLHRQPTLLVPILLLIFTITTARAGESWSLNGRVVDPEGSAIPGATVIALSGGEVAAGSASDDRGRFSFKFPSTVLPGAVTVRVTSVGYSATLAPAAEDSTCIRLRSY